MRSLTRAALIAIVALLVPAGVAQADTFRVNKLGDSATGSCTSNHCTLREAVLAANNDSPGPDRVLLPNRRRPYRLAIPNTGPPSEDGNLEGDLDVTNAPLAIIHRGKGVATIDANTIDRVIHAFERLALKRIRVTGGNPLSSTEDDGGAIFAAAGLALNRSRVVANTGNDGGAIWLDDGNLTVSRSVLANNSSADDGGAITARGDDNRISISRSRLSGNDADGATALGGALDLSGNALTVIVSRTTFAGNTALSYGGAINFDNPGRLRVRYSTFSDNRAGEDGGAILIDGADLNVVNSTMANNRANSAGGGIAALGSVSQVSLNAATIVRNVADVDNNEGIAAIGGGLFGDNAGAFAVRNSVIALNRDAGVGNDCAGTDPVASLGGNLISTDLGCAAFDGPGDKVRANPKIGRLKRNGGPTKTVALKKRSPAIGNARKATAPNRDQRRRKRDNDPDSGAFERVR